MAKLTVYLLNGSSHVVDIADVKAAPKAAKQIVSEGFFQSKDGKTILHSPGTIARVEYERVE